jgi:hypothetical protein
VPDRADVHVRLVALELGLAHDLLSAWCVTVPSSRPGLNR